MVIIVTDEKKEPLNELQQNEEIPPPYSARQLTIDGGNFRPQGVYRTNNRSTASPVSIASPSRYRLPPLPLWPVRPPPLDIHPVNNHHGYHENGSLRQQFVIDPYLRSGGNGHSDEGEDDGERRNLKIILQSGDVNADVWILGGDEGRPIVKTSIEIRNENGPMTIRIHTTTRPTPLHLILSTRNAPLTLHLPRSLAGPLITRTPNGWVSLSSDLSADVTMFSESGRRERVRKGWIGDVGALREFVDESTWRGSFVDLACENGRMRISYVDEDEERLGGRKRSSTNGSTRDGPRRLGSG